MKKRVILFGLLFTFFTSFSCFTQIPVLTIKKDILKMDSIFEGEAISKNYFRAFNRWFKQYDVNKDGKLDLILQSYQHQNRGGIVSILYNKSDSTNIRYQNDNIGNFYTEGDPGQFDVGDVDGDGNADFLIFTESYHGSPENKPLEWYGTMSNDHSVDKLFLNNGNNSFRKLLFPDTLNSISGRLIDINNDNKKEIIVTNGDVPVGLDPLHLDSNVLFKYDLIGNKIIRNSFLHSNNINNYSRVSHATEIGNNIYFQLQSINNQFDNPVFVISFKKGDPLSLLSKHDTVAIIPANKKIKDGYVYSYFPVNEFGIHIVDLDNNGTMEVVTQEAMNIKYSNGNPVAKDIDTFNLGIDGFSHTRIQVYNKSGNISNNWLDSTLQYDPTRIAHGAGIKLEDINNDGLVDIVPIVGWGWWPFTMGDSLIAKEIRKKRILLNKGNKFESFILNFSNDQDLNTLQVQSFIYPLFPEKNKPGSILYITDRIPTGNNTYNATSGVISLDFSQFKFPCSSFLPQNNLKDNFIFCNSTDSVLLKIDSVAGYKTIWQKNGANIKTTNDIVIKEAGSFKVSVTNLGGCVYEKQFTVVKNQIPSTPTISRDTANNLVSSAAIRNTWYKDGTAISDTTQKIKPSGAGSFTVKTSENGCASVASNAYYYLVTDVINLSANEFIKLAPNPFQGQLNLDFNVKGYQKLNIDVFELTTGVKMASQQNILPGSLLNFGNLAPGTYIIKVSSNDQKLSHQFKMIKL